MQAHNPFKTAKPLVSTAKTSKGVRTRVNPEDLEICDDPLPKKRPVSESPYEKLFRQLNPGQCLKVDPEYVNTVSNAMRQWIRRHDKKGLVVKSIKLYPGCKAKLGRVWMLKQADKENP